MATRTLNAALEAMLENEVFRPFIAVDLEFDGGNELNMWTGMGDTTVGSKTYTGAGTLLSVGDVEENSDMAAQGAILVLSGMPTSILSSALSEPYQGRRCTIYLGSLDAPTDYTEIFAGDMDVMQVIRGPETVTIQLEVESRLVTLERARVRRYTSADQKSRYPGDKGLDFVEVERDLVWGKKTDESEAVYG